jgi:hypothetical protein
VDSPQPVAGGFVSEKINSRPGDFGTDGCVDDYSRAARLIGSVQSVLFQEELGAACFCFYFHRLLPFLN